MLCLTNCSNDDAPTSVFTPEALKQTTWQAQMTVYNIEDEIDYTKQSILQFTNESEGIYTRTNEEDGYMWNTDFTYQVNGKIIVRQHSRSVDSDGIHRNTSRNGSL